MKRTEKVEVRVSLEEKEALASLAKSEGRSLSWLIRDVLEKYMALNLPATKKTLSLQIAFLAGIVGLTVGLFTAVLFERTTSLTDYTVQGTIGKSGFSFSVNEADGLSKQVRLKNDDVTMVVRVNVEDFDNISEKRVNIEICREHDDQCEAIAVADLELGDKSPSVWQTMSKDGKYIFLTVQALKS